MPQTDLHTEVQRWRYKRLLQPNASHGEPRLRMLSCGIRSVVLFPASATSGPQIPSPRLSVDSDIAPTGFFRPGWETDAKRVELREATDPGFQNPTAACPDPDQAPNLILNIIEKRGLQRVTAHRDFQQIYLLMEPDFLVNVAQKQNCNQEAQG